MGPQLENGYTKIADAILENIAKSKLNGTQFRILMIVWRSTYGWNKKSYALSESYLAEATGIHKQQIKRELKEMIEKGVLIETKAPTFNTSREIQFNKNYVESIEVTKKIPVNELGTSTGSELDTPTGSELDTQKRDIKKHINIQSEIDEIRKQLPSEMTKVSKSKDKLIKAIKEHGKEKILQSVNAYEKHVIEKRKTGFKDLQFMNESTFWNGRYVDYLNVTNQSMPSNEKIIDGVRYVGGLRVYE